MDPRTFRPDSIPANRLNRKSLKALLTELLTELSIVAGSNDGSGSPGNGPAVFTLTGVNTGTVLNHGLHTLTPQLTATLPDGSVASGVSVNYALDAGLPDPNNSVLTCPANWSGRVTLQFQ